MSCSGKHDQQVKDAVKEYYGKVLKSSQDLQSNACTLGKNVKNRYYGCGSAVPEYLEGMRVLDLGSGSGRDCFVLSKLVGEKGHVTGIDMTEELLEIARKYQDYHAKQFGYNQPNTEFVQGYIEGLTAAGLKASSVDVIISNCVINLSPDKRAVLTEAHKVLKEGGELYFSDVYVNQDLPEDVKKNNVLWGEGVAGALRWEELHKIAGELGFSQPRLVSANRFILKNKELEALVGNAEFVAVTYRLFKLPRKMEEPCTAIYKGSITGCEGLFKLDHRSVFPAEKAIPVSSELATILKCSRFKDAFTFQTRCSQDAAIPAESVVHPFEYVKQNDGTSQGFCVSKNGKID